MKRALIVAAIVFTVGILMSSCTKHVCPAYSQADSEEVEQLG